MVYFWVSHILNHLSESQLHPLTGNTLFELIVIRPGRDTRPVYLSSSVCNQSSHLSFFFPGTVIGVVIYTGKEMRSVLNTSQSKNKVGLFVVVCVYK